MKNNGINYYTVKDKKVKSRSIFVGHCMGPEDKDYVPFILVEFGPWYYQNHVLTVH